MPEDLRKKKFKNLLTKQGTVCLKMPQTLISTSILTSLTYLCALLTTLNLNWKLKSLLILRRSLIRYSYYKIKNLTLIKSTKKRQKSIKLYKKKSELSKKHNYHLVSHLLLEARLLFQYLLRMKAQLKT